MLVVAIVAMIATPAAAQVNTAPKPNIVGQNGLISPSIISTDPQIGACVFDGTGAVVTESTLTTFADATHYPCGTLRGAAVATSSTGLQSIRRNGLYRVNIAANCTGVTTETGIVQGMVSTDGGVTFAAISGAAARTKFLTGVLQQNMSATGYVTVSQTAASLAAGNVVFALQGSSSAASDMTCAAGGGLTYERVDQLQPATYP